MEEYSRTQTPAVSISADHTLWRNQSTQRSLSDQLDEPQPPKKPTQRSGKLMQRDLTLSMLREARRQGVPLSLPEILKLGIAPFSTLPFELRSAGFQSENRMRREDGTIHSYYRLLFDPERDPAVQR
jgi:hypothetical protein